MHVCMHTDSKNKNVIECLPSVHYPGSTCAVVSFLNGMVIIPVWPEIIAVEGCVYFCVSVIFVSHCACVCKREFG